MKNNTVIVTGGSEDGTMPNQFWYQDEYGEKHGPYNSWEDTIRIHNLRDYSCTTGED